MDVVIIIVIIIILIFRGTWHSSGLASTAKTAVPA